MLLHYKHPVAKLELGEQGGYPSSLVPRPCTPPVFDHLAVCMRPKTGGIGGLGMRLYLRNGIKITPP